MIRIIKKILKIAGILFLALFIFIAGVLAYNYRDTVDMYYAMTNQDEKRLTFCNKILDKNPEDEWALFTRARFYIGKKEFERSHDDAKKLFEVYTKRIEENPKDVVAYFQRSQLYDRSQSDKAISDLDRVIELKPHKAIAYYMRGRKYYEMEKYDKAIADYTTFLDMPFYIKFWARPKVDSWVLYERSQAYFENDQYEKAEVDLLKANELEDQKYGEFPLQMRWVLAIGDQNLDKVIEACTRILKYKPNDDFILSLRNKFYERNKQYDEAIANLGKLIDLRPMVKDYYIERAILYQKKGDFKSALSDCEIAMKGSHRWLAPYNRRGRIYLEMKEYKKALDDFNKVIELRKKIDWAEPYLYRGDTYRLLGEDEKALADYAKASSLYACENRVYLEMAKLLEKAGKKDEAITSYRKYIAATARYVGDNPFKENIKFAEERVKALGGI